MFILGNELDYLVEVYKEKIVIGKKNPVMIHLIENINN